MHIIKISLQKHNIDSHDREFNKNCYKCAAKTITSLTSFSCPPYTKYHHGQPFGGNTGKTIYNWATDAFPY